MIVVVLVNVASTGASAAGIGPRTSATRSRLPRSRHSAISRADPDLGPARAGRSARQSVSAARFLSRERRSSTSTTWTPIAMSCARGRQEALQDRDRAHGTRQSSRMRSSSSPGAITTGSFDVRHGGASGATRRTSAEGRARAHRRIRSVLGRSRSCASQGPWRVIPDDAGREGAAPSRTS